MIIVTDPSKPFTFGPKGAPRRAPILSEYTAEIEAAYANADKDAQIEPPKEWSAEASLTFVRNVVNGILKNPAADHEDIFEKGCDRLVALSTLC